MQNISCNNPSESMQILLAYYSAQWHVKPTDTGGRELSFLVGQAKGLEDDSS